MDIFVVQSDCTRLNMSVETLDESARRIPDIAGGITAIPGASVLVHDVMVRLVSVDVVSDEERF